MAAGLLAGLAPALAAARRDRAPALGAGRGAAGDGSRRLVVAAGLAACWVPARRAARVDPAVALRAE